MGLTIHGIYIRVAVDRNHLRAAGMDARPWLVKDDLTGAAWRCVSFTFAGKVSSEFNLAAKPAVWIQLSGVLEMQDVEVLI